MTLTSLSFAGFVIVALIGYYLLPLKRRWMALLAASMAFYGIVCFKYMPYIAITIFTTYIGAILIEKREKAAKAYIKEHKAGWTREEKSAYRAKVTSEKRFLLVTFLVLNFGILGFLKYYDFLGDTIEGLLGLMGITVQAPELGLILPLGISFYTFQAMGYLIDVYREKVPAERNLGKFALFVSFFPQIIQGPIGIYDHLAGQLYEGHKLEYNNLKYGFQLVLWGLFKKLVIADRAVVLINTICGDIDGYSGTWMLTAALFYALQLYCDFSGGIDISRGVAQMFGITMAENFKRPYFAKTINEYWKRWHITLGAWLMSYLFYPIAMSDAFLKLGKKTKKSLGKHVGKVLPGSIATFITFMVIGIWHGANWKYVAFGAWNGAIIFASNLLEPQFVKLTEKLRIRTQCLSFRLFQMARTFLIVLIGYYFDIADGFVSAMKMMYKSVMDFNPMDWGSKSVIESIGIAGEDYLVILVGMLILFVVSFYQEKTGQHVREALARQNALFRWSVMLAAVVIVIIFGYYGPGTSASEFVYMQF